MKILLSTDIRNNTRLMQEAIDGCSSNGGGTISIPAGTHLCGSIVLKSNVHLHLPKGSVLMGSPDFGDYPELPGGFKDAVGHIRSRCFIYAYRAENISITGEGAIDGNGAAFGESHPEHLKRPFLLRINECRNVGISGITLRNSAAWVCHLQRSDELRISDVTIRSRCNHNNDGIDVDSCRQVKISGCDIDTGDDALCFKTTSSKPCEHIEVDNCRLKSSCGALKFGTESYGNFRKINVKDCEIYDTLLCAIKFCAMDGGDMEDISISGIDIRNSTGPFFFRLGERGNVYMDGSQKKAGAMRNIILEDITADVMDRGMEHSGILMTGIPSGKIEDIKLKDIRIIFPGGGTIQHSRNVPEEQISNYPEPSYFGVLPSSAFFIRHARRIILNGISVSMRRPDTRSMLVSEDVEDSKLELECAAGDIVFK